MTSVRGVGALVVLGSILGLGCAAARAPSKGPLESPRVAAAREVVPADLDVVVWLDLERLRGLWPVQPERQIARILAEYGVLSARDRAEAAFWLKLVAQSQRFWIGCRPTRDGCIDAVVYAQGHFGRPDPIAELHDLTSPRDVGAGWLRYDRRSPMTRHNAGRIYAAPPDRVVVVGVAEFDAVERTLEDGKSDSTLQVDERGLASIVMRASSLARQLERRAPAAARLLRQASTVRLVLDARSSTLELTVVFAFSARDDVERAKLALAILAPKLGLTQSLLREDAAAIEVVGNDLVLRLRLRAPAEDAETNPPRIESLPGREPAAQ